MNSVKIGAGRGLRQAICLGSRKSYRNVDCEYCDIQCSTYSSICLIHVAVRACFKPAEIWVHLLVDLSGLQFLSSLFFFDLFLNIFKIRSFIPVINQILKGN